MAYPILATILFSVMFLSRFVIKLGASEISVTLPLMVGGLLYLLLTGRAYIALPRLALFAFTCACLLSTVLLGGGGRISAASISLLLVLYACFMVVLAPEEGDCFPRIMWLFRRCSAVIAVSGITQFAGQFLLHGPTLFTFEGLLPSSILTQGYNFVIPLNFGGLNKSNGFFLLEPSMLSQIMALAMIVELLYFNRLSMLCLFMFASLLSYSGTGLILAAAFVPLLVLRRGNPWLLIGLLSIGLLVFASADALHLSTVTGRVDELNSTQSSGFARFVSPWLLIRDYILPHAGNTLFGLGPGSVEPYVYGVRAAANYTSFDSTWGKIFFEYGLVGTLPFALYVGRCMFAETPSMTLSAALLLNFLLLAGYLLDPRMIAEMLVLVTLYDRSALQRSWRGGSEGTSSMPVPHRS